MKIRNMVLDSKLVPDRWGRQLSAIWLLLDNNARANVAGFFLLRVAGTALDFTGIALIGILISGSVEGRVSIKLGEAELVSIPVFTLNHIYFFGVFAALAFLTRTIYSVVVTRAFFAYLGRLATEASVQIFRKITAEDFDFRRKYSLSEVQFLLTSSTNLLFTQLVGGAVVLVSDLVSVALFAALIFTINFFFGFGVVVFAAAVVATIYATYAYKNSLVGSAVKAATQRTIQSLADFSNVFSEAMAFGKIAEFEMRFRVPRTMLADSAVNALAYRMFPRSILEGAFALGVIGFVIANASIPSSLGLGGAEIGAFGAAVLRLSSTLLPIQQGFALLSQAQKQVGNALALLRAPRGGDQSTSSHPSTNAVDPYKADNSIILKSLSFHYSGSSVSALTNISLEVPAGGYMAIIGPSGAGKSTLVELILGLASPSAGTVLLGGSSPTKFRQSRPGNLAYLPQKPGFISGTVAENVALGEPVETINVEQVVNCLENVGLIEVVNDSLGGVHGQLGSQIKHLSGGQLQRLGLARALYFKPSILILDEATSNLDSKSERLIEQALLRLESTTILSVAHKLHTIRNADSVAYLENGRLVASGPLEVMKKELKIFAEYSRATRI